MLPSLVTELGSPMVSHARRPWKRKVEPGAAFPQHISQAKGGCDFGLLEAGAQTPVPQMH